VQVSSSFHNPLRRNLLIIKGGMIALGVGKHQWTVKRCISKYEYICEAGLDAKLLTKSWMFGWIARWFRESIYLSDALENALMKAYGEKELFSLSTMSHGHTTRVAVTTTVHTDRKLFTNYKRGGSGEYLDSTSLTWQV
jgi:hypothetical protein